VSTIRVPGSYDGQVGIPVHDSSTRIVGYVGAGIGTALLLVALPFYMASGLMAPAWAIVVLLLVWLTLFVLAVRWFRSHPLRVLLLPVVAMAVWFAAMYAGELLLGWTA